MMALYSDGCPEAAGARRGWASARLVPSSTYRAYPALVPMASWWASSRAWVMESRRRPVSTGQAAFACPSAARPTSSRPRESAGPSAESHSRVWSLTCFR
jgi:hypothetical protein